jgi:large repetitive protein
MTRTLRNLMLCASLLATAFFNLAGAQSAMQPTDPVPTYNPNAKPTPPGWMQIGQWVRSPNTAVANRNPSWGSGILRYKAYMFQGIAFRLLFPKSYNPTANDGKKYPLIMFFHGKGENAKAPLYDASTGMNYDNEFQLLQGPYEFDQANQTGKYDGYVLVPQITDAFYQGILDNLMLIVKYMIANNKVDPFRIIANGLSEGGIASWEMVYRFPTYIGASAPMSSPTPGITFGMATDPNYLNNIKFTPIWMSHGLLDGNPSPAQVNELKNTMTNAGANFRLLTIPNAAHSTWYQMWAQPDFYQFVNRAYSANPWMLFSPKFFWPGQAVSGTIGVAPGFQAYEWRRNGVPIPGATGNTINITSGGTYDARVKRDDIWSDWSRTPWRIRPGFYEAENYANMAGVLTEATTDVDGGLNVGWIDFGDWMDYTVHPNVAGTFTLQLRLAASQPGGTILAEPFRYAVKTAPY